MRTWRRASPIVRFGALAIVPVVALGAVLAFLLSSDVQQRYLDTARSSATLISRVGVQPLFTADEMSLGLTPAQIATIDQALQGAAVSQEVRRLKVWNGRGTIIYSDNPALIGRTFPIDDDLRNALHGSSSASVTDGHDEENAGDNLAGPLIQAYVPMIFNGSSTPSGAFELYLPYAPVQASIDRESQQLYLFLGIGLVLFYLSMFPLVVLAVRWERHARQVAADNLVALERLNHLKSQFLVGISHHFRTALVGIEGFSELIRDSEHLDPMEVRQFAEDIHADARSLEQALDRIVAIDGADARATTLPPDRMELEQVVNDVAEATHEVAG